MLQAALKTYERALDLLPSPGGIDSGFPKELDNTVKALRLGTEADAIRGKALCLAVLLALPTAALYLTTRDIAALFIMILIPMTAYVTVLLLPVALFKMEKARLVADSLAFVLSFTTLLQHMNQEDAYRRSIKDLSTGVFMEAWIKLRLGELSSVSDALMHLAGRAMPYSVQLYSIFRGAASEVQEETPDYRALLRDSLSAIQAENSIELGKFTERFRAASAVVSFMPVSLFLAIPFASAFTGHSVSAAFLSASLGVVAITFLSILYLAASYPSSASFADLSSVDPDLAEHLGVKYKRPRTKMFTAAFIILSVLSPASPVSLILLGVLLIVYAVSNSHIPRLLEAVKRETIGLPLDMREVSYRLRRGEPLESALTSTGSVAMKAVKLGATRRLFPERTFFLLEDVVEGLKHSGEALATALEELRVYIRELLNYRNAMEAQLDSARGYLFLLYILLPILSLFSLWAFDFIAKVSYMGGEAPYLGLAGFSLVSKPPELRIVLGFVSPAVLICMAFLTLLSALCEDVVAPQLITAKTGLLGVGTLILGIGELILLM